MSTPLRPLRPAFVGRAHELIELHAALDQAFEGQGQFILIAGEPGIGKTRLAEELARAAEQQGASVLWGRCWEGDGAPAFWPWVQMLRSYIQSCPPDILAREMAAGAADLAHILPEVHDQLPGLSTPAATDPEYARFRFFDGVATLLRNAARRQPLVLLVDDLHWADTSSLRLLL